MPFFELACCCFSSKILPNGFFNFFNKFISFNLHLLVFIQKLAKKLAFSGNILQVNMTGVSELE